MGHPGLVADLEMGWVGGGSLKREVSADFVAGGGGLEEAFVEEELAGDKGGERGLGWETG